MKIFNFTHARSDAKKGFTLIETFVAISVLLLSLSGPLALAASSLQTAYYARDQVTAFYLAQEGVEYIRAKRDQNYLATPASPWLTGISDCVNAVCNVDFPNFTHTVCVSGSCPALLYNASTGLFTTTSGNASPFRREVTIQSVSADEISVRVRIFWTSQNIPRTFEIRENLLNWI